MHTAWVEKLPKTRAKLKVERDVRSPEPRTTVTSFFSVDAVTTCNGMRRHEYISQPERTGSTLLLASSRLFIGRSRHITWMQSVSDAIAKTKFVSNSFVNAFRL